MELYADNKKIKDIILKPTYTIGHVKEQLDNWLLPQGYSYSMTIYRSDGSVIDSNKYSYNLFTDKLATGGKILVTVGTDKTPSGIPRSPSSRPDTRRGFTGNRDIDILILEKLDDRDLLNACLTDTRINNICQDDTFWYKRYVKKFGNEHLDIKPKDRSWRNQYLKNISVLDKYRRKNEDVTASFLGYLSQKFTVQMDHETPFGSAIDTNTMSDRDKILYYHLNLGDQINIEYIIDRYDEADPDDKIYSYETRKYFTPEQVIELISKFYGSAINREDLRKQQEEYDNPYAEDFTPEQADAGEITRGLLIANMFWEGVYVHGNNTYELVFGS